MASRFHAFDDSGSLGSASAGILCGKTTGVLFIGQVIDKQGNIHILYETAILGAELLGSIVRNDIFPAISQVETVVGLQRKDT